MGNTQPPPPPTDDEIADMLLHLDDETEWENISDFWNAWGPRQTNRIERLILAVQKARADLVELRADVLRLSGAAPGNFRDEYIDLCERIRGQG